jgi:hypothetical protein
MAFWQDSNRLLIDGELVPESRGGTFPSISRENGTPGLEELLQTTLLARPAAS